MGINLGDTVPDFKAETSQGDIQWHQYIDGTWAILFSHPGDFTPVCTTELGGQHQHHLHPSHNTGSKPAALRSVPAGQVGKLQKQFADRGFKLAALSCNDTESHKA